MKKIWLIRIKNHIFGPMDQDELNRMADEKHISPKDEVTKNLKQWIFFKNLPKASRGELYDSEKTAEASLSNISKRASSKKLLENTAAIFLPNFSKKKGDETNIPVTESSPQSDKTIDLEKAEVIDYKVSPQEASAKGEETESSEAKPQFASQESVRKSQTPYRSVYFIWFAAVGLAGLAGFLYFFQKEIFVLKKTAAVISFKEDLLEAGNYKQVLEAMKKSQVSEDSDRLVLASLLLQEEGNVYESQNVLEKISEANLSPEEQGRLLVLKGLLEHQDHGYSQAESFFDLAIQSSIKDQWPAYINKVLLKIKINESQEALNILNSLIEKGFQQKLIFFLKSYLEIDSSNEEIDQILSLLSEDGGAYSQEAFVLLAYRNIMAEEKLPEENMEASENQESSQNDQESPQNQESSKSQEVSQSDQRGTQDQELSQSDQEDAKNQESSQNQEFSQDEQEKVQNDQKNTEQSSLEKGIFYMIKALDQNPYLQYKYDILSYKPSKIWEDFLLNICSKIYNKSPESSEFLAFYSYCLARAGKIDLSQPHIEKAINQSPKSPLFQSVYSFILSLTGLEEKAVSYMNLASQNTDSEFTLPFVLNGLFCQKLEDVKCAEEMWKKAASLRPGSVSVFAGKAWIHSRLGQNDLAQKMITEGIEKFPDSLDLLRLQSDLQDSPSKQP